jgi:aldehyde dehydrogenase (NAD+)
VFVEESIMDAFIAKFSALMRSRKIGDPAETDTFQGPQSDKAQRDRIISLLDGGKETGELVMGGTSTTVNGKVSSPKASPAENGWSRRLLTM